MSISKSIKYFLIFIFFTVINGCIFLSPELKTLKKIGDEQKEISRYLERQSRLFERLIKDVKENRLKKKISQARVIALYGEPILTYEAGKEGLDEVFFYRYPTKYFTSDKIYLYFDNFGKLVSWEYIPYEKP